MGYYPVYIDLSGKNVLVVGGGRVAKRKIETLLEFGANVRVVSRELSSEIKRYIDDKMAIYLGPEFHESFLDSAFIVITATDDKALNSQISRIARARGLLVNVVDQPEDCNFIVPSIIKRGDLIIAISTSGKSPAMARAIRERLESQFGNEYADFLEVMGKLRNIILNMGFSQERNMTIFKGLVESDLFDAISNGQKEKAIEIINEITGIPGEQLKTLI